MPHSGEMTPAFGPARAVRMQASEAGTGMFNHRQCT